MRIKLFLACALTAFVVVGCDNGDNEGTTDKEKVKSTIVITSNPVNRGTIAVKVDGAVIDTKTETIAEGSLVTIEAVGTLGYDFVAWDTDVALDDADANPTTFTMPAESVDIEAEFSANELVTDEGIQIGSHVWATRNVGLPGTFASSPTDPGLLYQFDRNTGWSVADPMTAYGLDGNAIAGAEWNSRDEVGTAWSAENNPCPPGWRLPILNELGTITQHSEISSTEWLEATATASAGMKFNCTRGEFFLPAAGKRNKDTGALEESGVAGYYWTGEESNKTAHKGGFFLYFTGTDMSMKGDVVRATGYSLRCHKGDM